MNPFFALFVEIVERPILNMLLVLLSIVWWNLGRSVIILTVLIRIALIPITSSGNQMQKHMSDLQPKLKEIQEKYKDNAEKLRSETMKLFKSQWAWPLKWCMWLLVQLPVFLWLYRTILSFSQNTLTPWLVYSFVPFLTTYLTKTNVDYIWMGIDLLSKHNILLTILAWVLIYAQTALTQMMQPAAVAVEWAPDMTGMMKYMNIFMVAIMWSFVYQVQAWVWLYIVTTTLFGVVQLGWQYREVLKVKFNILTNR